jgi:nitrile hydratase
MDGVHDMGGMHGFGPVVTDDGALTHRHEWEIRVQVITLLAGRSMRDAIERLESATYLSSSYYERWLRAGEMKLVEQGRITTDDLARWHDVFAHDAQARPPVTDDPESVERVRRMRSDTFEPAPDATHVVGDRVRVIRMRPAGHHRCPRYLRGATGTVERVLGADLVPGLSAGDHIVEPVYTVEFSSLELFGDPIVGPADDPSTDDPAHSVLIDLFERYLEPVR